MCVFQEDKAWPQRRVGGREKLGTWKQFKGHFFIQMSEGDLGTDSRDGGDRGSIYKVFSW